MHFYSKTQILWQCYGFSRKLFCDILCFYEPQEVKQCILSPNITKRIGFRLHSHQCVIPINYRDDLGFHTFLQPSKCFEGL